ncbi:pseudouridine synthase PUS2 NDAI_0I00810 [Naumovozyma dairenensis CBS 421]|uniref:tRNA pseudouridine synthase 1 n=1 Tax=Naumovozyma dairenensis (strain ATCC 10597 / BCRC 20456 / CBS 421 / NBRC 0211 / NRRL Y-12639) TaxID=1071378 RepID=G0WFT9_NAUDC|nr:hypothetical protein NDAI_0I00810 [Naumovozyma dairenensis CBS 421]CCD26650.1 hypothetical protein NDAI_0I00810 [Naumovozyma dairenensis CBS 421]
MSLKAILSSIKKTLLGTTPTTNEVIRKIPKRRVAIMLGYRGTGYYGMQYNPPRETIESTLFNALVSVDAISEKNSLDISKNGLMRTARTDKGVHAAGNLISLKVLMKDPNTLNELKTKLNGVLSESGSGLKIWDIRRINKSFNCRKVCSSRWYEYLLPACVLDNTVTRGPLNLDILKKYRVSDTILNKFQNVSNQYIGSHNFHNFTVKKTSTDLSCKRYVKKIIIAPLVDMNNIEWISVRLHGQSFMMNQIRKMLSLAIYLTRYDYPSSTVNSLFATDIKVYIPNAPASGLLLDFPIFDAYNEKLIKLGYSPIEFNQYRKKMNDFKKK